VLARDTGLLRPLGDTCPNRQRASSEKPNRPDGQPRGWGAIAALKYFGREAPPSEIRARRSRRRDL